MKKLVIIFLSLCGIIHVFGRSKLDKPPMPEIISISIKPGSDSVVMKWELSASAGIDSCIIYEYIPASGGGGGEPTTSVTVNDPALDEYTFYFPKVGKQPVCFSIVSFKGGLYSDLNDSYHRTIYMKLNYDSCNSQVNLAWTNYIGWGSQLKKYEIYQELGGVTEKKGETTDTVFNVSITANENYLFYVVAVHTDGTTTSRSNDTACYTQMPEPPAYTIAQSASFITNNIVSLKFSLDINSEIDNYQLYTSDSPEGDFQPVKFFTGYYGKSGLSYNDTIKGEAAPKYYRLDAMNNCGLAVAQSNMATAMVPSVAYESNLVNLSWNSYKTWTQGINQYNIYRSIGEGTFEEVGNTTGDSDHYSDNVKSLIGMQLSGNICYRVEAQSNYDDDGARNTSLSATVCIDLSEEIFIPNAFTPNNDGLNDEFKPVFPFLPDEYQLMVYNRYGFKIFESADPLEGWDGTTGNGKKAPEGTYVYFIKYASQNGKAIEKTGNFSLIY